MQTKKIMPKAAGEKKSSLQICVKETLQVCVKKTLQRLSRKRRMGAEERRSSEIFVNLSKCISRIDFPENNAPDLSTHHLPKRKRNS
ncbi:hypothetical protein ACLKA6_002277 [Drosophila palustris]